MYSSDMIGLQWRAAIRGIDDAITEEVQVNGLTYMPEIDDLLERRERLSRALLHSGETPYVKVDA